MTRLKETLQRFLWSIYGRYAWDSAAPLSSDLMNRISSGLIARRKHPGESVLDAGCGTGNYSIHLAQAGFQVTGVDSASGMIRIAREKIAGQADLPVSFERISLSAPLRFPDASFDHIVIVSVLQLVGDPLSTLRELTRVLKPEGDITIVHFQKPGCGDSRSLEQAGGSSKSGGSFLQNRLRRAKSFLERVGLAKYWTRDELMSLLHQAKLNIIAGELYNPIVFMATKQ